MTSASSLRKDCTTLHGTAQRMQLRLLRMFRGRGRLELIELFADKRQILHVEERDVEHVTDDDYSAACLYDLQHTHVHRSPTDRFDDRQYNVATIENWNRQHVQDRQVHIQNHAEPQRQLPAAFALEKQIVNATDPDGTAQMLRFYIRLGRGNCANCV